MNVDKVAVLDALRRKGLNIRAEWVEREMPDLIDVKANADLLETLGFDFDRSLAAGAAYAPPTQPESGDR